MSKLQGYSRDLVTRMVQALREISDDTTFEDGIKNYLGDDLALEVLIAIENSTDKRKYIRRDNIRERVLLLLKNRRNGVSAQEMNKILVKEGFDVGHCLGDALAPLINKGIIIWHGKNSRRFYKLA